MAELKLVGWVDFDSEYPTKNTTQEELSLMIELIKQDILKNGYRFSGEEHQNALTGVPLFSDGTCFRASMRAWGTIMAMIYSDVDGINYPYMEFYMSLDNSVLPEYKTIDILPNKDVEESFGCTVKEDAQLINEALSYGMPLMTTDKVLSVIMDKYNNK